MARDRGEAEELTQQTFVRVWERLGSFRGESAFSTWLHRVAVNVVIGGSVHAKRSAIAASTPDTASPSNTAITVSSRCCCNAAWIWSHSSTK